MTSGHGGKRAGAGRPAQLAQNNNDLLQMSFVVFAIYAEQNALAKQRWESDRRAPVPRGSRRSPAKRLKKQTEDWTIEEVQKHISRRFQIDVSPGVVRKTVKLLRSYFIALDREARAT